MSYDNNEELANNVEEFCNAFSEPERVRLVKALDNGEKCLCELARASCMHPQVVWNHMRVLSRAGVIVERKEGKWTYYTQGIDALEPAGYESCIYSRQMPAAMSPVKSTQNIDSTLGKVRSSYMYEAEALIRRGL